MLIDTHCHINSDELRRNARSVIQRAYDAKVSKMVLIGSNFEDSCEAVALSEDFSQFGLYASIGIHPHDSKDYGGKIPDEFVKLVQSERVVAYGEIGLDYHYDNSPRLDQQKMFELQLDFAGRVNKPVILHIREAMNDAMEILSGHRGLKFLFHCYSGGLEYLDEVLALNAMCAFGGALTWPSKSSEELREVFRKIPIENVFFETDAPYMSPVPFRGKINEPAYIRYVYEKAAEIKNMTVNALAAQVSKNASKFLGWD